MMPCTWRRAHQASAASIPVAPLHPISCMPRWPPGTSHSTRPSNGARARAPRRVGMSNGAVEWDSTLQRRMGQVLSASRDSDRTPESVGCPRVTISPDCCKTAAMTPTPLHRRGGHCCKTASMTLPSCRVRMAKAYGWAVGPVPRLQALSFGPYAKSSGFGASRARPGSMGPGLRPSGRMPDARRLALGRPVREA